MTQPSAGYTPPVYIEWPNKPSPKEAEKMSAWHVHNYVRLLDHVGKIVAELDARRNWTPPAYKPHRMTYLKLLMVASYARTFLFVGSKHAQDLRFLDVLSASGLSFPDGKKHPVPGSCFFTPLCHQDFSKPQTTPKYQFTKMWAFDGEQSNLDALTWRHDQLAVTAGFKLPALSTYAGDINTTLPQALEPLAQEREALFAQHKKRPLYLAFVDNEALDVHMSTIAVLQKKVRADLIIHVPTSSIARLIGQEAATGNVQYQLTAFFGNERWREVKTDADVARIYQENIRSHTDAEFQVLNPVPIRGTKASFALVVCARQTDDSGDKGWVARNERLAEACAKFDVDKMDAVLDKVLKGQKDLFGFG